MELIGLEDLPEKMRVGLEDSFRKRLFKIATKRLKKVVILAKELNCHSDTISNLRKGKFFLRVIHLKKLSEITEMPLDDIEKHINELRSKDRRKRIKTKLPIFSSPELASLIAHCMADGNLAEKQFSFFNKQRDLINEVIKNVKKAFSTNINPVEFEKDGGWEIEFPANIARLIALAGGPMGEKVFLPFSVPKWIKNGNNRIKAAFIRALIDDEGSVSSKLNKISKGTSREIKFGMVKNEKFIKNHMEFLNDIRGMLLSFGIESSNIRKFGITKNGVFMGFSISRFENLSRFLEVISLSSREKKQKLIRCLNQFKAFEDDLIQLKLENPYIFKV